MGFESSMPDPGQEKSKDDYAQRRALEQRYARQGVGKNLKRTETSGMFASDETDKLSGQMRAEESLQEYYDPENEDSNWEQGYNPDTEDIETGNWFVNLLIQTMHAFRRALIEKSEQAPQAEGPKAKAASQGTEAINAGLEEAMKKRTMQQSPDFKNMMGANNNDAFAAAQAMSGMKKAA